MISVTYIVRYFLVSCMNLEHMIISVIFIFPQVKVRIKLCLQF